MIGKIQNISVDTGKNTELLILFADVQLSNGGNCKCQIFPGIGEDAIPCVGDIVTVGNASGILYITGFWDGKETSLKQGEKRIFSRDEEGNEKAEIFLNNEGNIELNGNEKSLVTWAELNEALQSMWAEVKRHTHPTPSGASSPSAELAAVMLDIEDSKTNTILTGG